MPTGKIRNKLKPNIIAKINARYSMKLKEFSEKSLEELQEIFKTTKMSSTDKHALLEATDMKLREESNKILTEASKNVKDGNNIEEE